MRLFFFTVLLTSFLISYSGKAQNITSDKPQSISNPEYGIWQDKETPISFELVQTFGGENSPIEALLSTTRFIQTLIIDKSSNIYLQDSRNNRLISYNKNGQLRWSVNKEGRGPGDISTSYDFTWNQKDKLYLLNIRSTRLDEFDLDGNYLTSYSLSGLNEYGATTVEYLSPDTFLLSSPIKETYGAHIQIINIASDSLLESEFQLKSFPEIKIPRGFYQTTPVKVLNDRIVLGSDHSYGFYIYNLEGKRVKKVTREIDANVSPAVVINPPPGSNSFTILGESYPPIKLNQEFYIQQNKWPTNIEDPNKFLQSALDRKKVDPPEFKYSIDLLNNNYKLLYSYEYTDNDNIGIIRAIDHEGYLYTVTDSPYPQIHKYKVTLNE
ncbi:MAG: 6-bladed beta-propeller [Balneola sp.]